MIKISPSILSADFAKLDREIGAVCGAGADLLHVDVMDGCFVPNITIGPPVIRCIKPCSGVPLDVHLMIKNPEKFLDDFIKAGADILTVHAEASDDLGALISRIRKAGAKPSVSINPGTPASAVLPYLKDIDMVLVMTVEPGFGGQKLIESTLPKVTEIRRRCDALGISPDIEVDGGITPDNAARAAAAGANVFVAGSAVFNADDMAAAVSAIRNGALLGLSKFPV